MVNLSLRRIKKLYYIDRLSTIEIGKQLNVTPWVVIRFMKKTGLLRRNLKETNKIVFERKPSSFSLKRNLSKEEEMLKIAGIMLYWAEGARSNQAQKAIIVDFTNSNPRMVQLFLRFMREICGVDENRLRVLLYCYANQNIDILKKFWHKTTSIALRQFSKPYIRKDFLPTKINKMRYGLIHVRYCDKKLLAQIESWIEEYLKGKN